jgi:hypothetical protein
MKKLLKVLLISLGFILILVTSELLFMWRKGEFSKTSTYIRLHLAQQELRNGSAVTAWQHIQKAADFHQWYIYITRYRNHIPMVYLVHEEGSLLREQNRDKFKSLIASIDIDELVQTEKSNLAYFYYRLGLDIDDFEIAEPFMLKAVYLAPELSHYYVELANLYAHQLLIAKANEVLERCMRLEAPARHCRDYYGYINEGGLEPKGFLQETIDDYYFKLPRRS